MPFGVCLRVGCQLDFYLCLFTPVAAVVYWVPSLSSTKESRFPMCWYSLLSGAAAQVFPALSGPENCLLCILKNGFLQPHNWVQGLMYRGPTSPSVGVLRLFQPAQASALEALVAPPPPHTARSRPMHAAGNLVTPHPCPQAAERRPSHMQ